MEFLKTRKGLTEKDLYELAKKEKNKLVTIKYNTVKK